MNLEGTNIHDWSEDHWRCFCYKLSSRTQQEIMNAHGVSETEGMGLHRNFKEGLGMAPEAEVDFSNPPRVIFYR